MVFKFNKPFFVEFLLFVVEVQTKKKNMEVQTKTLEVWPKNNMKVRMKTLEVQPKNKNMEVQIKKVKNMEVQAKTWRCGRKRYRCGRSFLFILRYDLGGNPQNVIDNPAEDPYEVVKHKDDPRYSLISQSFQKASDKWSYNDFFSKICETDISFKDLLSYVNYELEKLGTPTPLTGSGISHNMPKRYM